MLAYTWQSFGMAGVNGEAIYPPRHIQSRRIIILDQLAIYLTWNPMRTSAVDRDSSRLNETGEWCTLSPFLFW